MTQDPNKPGASFNYEFTVVNPGSQMYHSHHNSAEQATKDVMGAFIIEPMGKSAEPKVDAEHALVLHDSGIGLTLNGKSFPATQPIVAKQGQTVPIRYMNEGLLIYPMHLHCLPQTVFAKVGWPLPYPYKCDTLIVGPGECWDVTVLCDQACVGVSLPHSHARRVVARHVRHGDRHRGPLATTPTRPLLINSKSAPLGASFS